MMVKRANYSTVISASECSECKGALNKELTIECGKSRGTKYRYIATFCCYDCLNVWEGKNGNQSSIVTEHAND